MKSIWILIAGLCLLNSCADALLTPPEARLSVFIKTENDQLEEVENIYAKETRLYFANKGEAFFSVIYTGDKEMDRKSVDENGDSITIWKSNHVFTDREVVNYFDRFGKRAVTGNPLSYQDNYNMFLSNTSFTYQKAGEYTVYLEAINTNEEGEVITHTDSITITVLEGE